MDSREANVAWYRDFLAGHGYTDLQREDLERGHYYSLREAIAFLTKAPEQEVLSILDMARGLEGYPYDLVKLPEGCEEVLRALSKTYAIGLVSSRIHEGIDQFYDFTGLRSLFEVTIGYEDTDGPQTPSRPSPRRLCPARRRAPRGRVHRRRPHRPHLRDCRRHALHRFRRRYPGGPAPDELVSRPRSDA